MATLFLDSSSSSVAHGADRAAPAGRSLGARLSAFFTACIEGRARRAQAQVDGYLASLNDETLIDLGLDPVVVRRPGVDVTNRFYL